MKFALNLSSRFPSDSRPSGVLPVLGSWLSDLPPPSYLSGKGCALLSLEGGRAVWALIRCWCLVALWLCTVTPGRSTEWAEGQRRACVGARGRPLRLSLRCLSLQFTSPSARFGVATFHFGVEGATHTCPLVFWHSAFSIGVRVFFFLGTIMISLVPAVCPLFSFCDKKEIPRIIHSAHSTACGRRGLDVRQATVAGCGLHRWL